MEDVKQNNSLEFVQKIEYHYTPVLVFLGTIGNCLTIYVILKTNLRKLSSSCCLVALAISDNISLINIFLSWLGMNGIDVFNRQVCCQLMVYSQYVCSCISAWLVITFTAERFVAVMYPLQSKSLCTISRVKLIILALVIFSLIIYSPLLYVAVPQAHNDTTNIIENGAKNITKHVIVCQLKDEWDNEAFYFNIFDTIITFVIPLGLIATLNACIINNILRFSKIRKKMTHDEQGTTTTRGKSKDKKSYNLTKMLLIVSTVCFMINLPSYVIRIITYLIELGEIKIETKEEETPIILAQQYSLMLFNTNFGINFSLYCISGQNFRRAVASICCKQKPRATESSTTERTQSTSSTGFKRRRPKMQMIQITMMSVLLSENQGITAKATNSDHEL